MRANISGIGYRPRFRPWMMTRGGLWMPFHIVACYATGNNLLRRSTEIRNIRRKGRRNFVERNNRKGLPADYVAKVADIMAFLIDIENIDEVFDLPKYKPHRLGGDRAGTYSFPVTANWRIAFRHDAKKNELYDVDYEDYH